MPTEAPDHDFLESQPPILVIDDDATILTLLKRQLGVLHREAVKACGWRAGLTAFEGGSWSLVLTDGNLPGIPQFDIVAALRSRDCASRTPIIAMSGDSSEAAQELARAKGADGFLSKPISLQALRLVIVRWTVVAGETGHLSEDGTTPLALAESARTAPPIDRSVLDSLVGPNEELHVRFLKVFAATLEETVPLVIEASSREEAEKVAALAHRLKSSSRAAGARELAYLFEDLELRARARDPEHIARLVKRLTVVWRQAVTYVGSL